MASHQEQLSKSIKETGYRADGHPVLVKANDFMSLSQYLSVVVVPEVVELEVELENWQSANDLAHGKILPPKNLLMELYDVVVVLGNAIDRVAPKFSIEQSIFSVNGQFQGNLAPMKEQVLNLGVGNAERNLQSIFTILLSMMKHLDIDLQTEIYIKLANKKLELNKASEFYQKEPGMSEADFLAKYEHVTAALRILRKFLRQTTGQEVTLQTWITRHFSEVILNWRNSDRAITQLKQELLQFQHQVKDEVSWMLTAKKWQKSPLLELRPPVVGVFKDYNDLELKMLLAGAKPIDVPIEVLGEASLQNTSGNATLGKTIFWV